ncbi:MAG: Gfo/Idh/MocA family oxidoreductase [Chthoniobacterales bacterium]
MNRTIKSAIIGLGRAGWLLHFEPMLQHVGYQITAVADPSESRRKEAHEKSGCETYETIDELLAKADCELVVVATPTSFHYSDAKKILEAGKHCVLEKPMALNAREADELVALATSKNLLLTIHHAQLFEKEFHHLKEIVDSGIIGRIFNIRVLWARYSRRWDWQTLQKNGGGLLNNWGTHLLSTTLPLLNSKVKTITADLELIKDAGDAEDHVELFLKMESGATANLTVTSVCAFPGIKWMFLGDKGTLISDGVTTQLKYFDPAEAPRPALEESMMAAGREYNSEKLPWKEESRPVEPSYIVPTFFENVADAINGKAKLIATAEDAAEITRILEVARKTSGF